MQPDRRVGVEQGDRPAVIHLIRQPLAWVPIALSLAVLAMTAGVLGATGVHREADEGTAAHIFQLWLVAEAIAVAAFAALWVPRKPREAIGVLTVQVCVALAACAPVALLHL